MIDSVEALIQKAIADAKSGKKDSALKALSQTLKQEPSNARAWYLLSQVVDEPERVIFCIKKVLEIDPVNRQAQERLDQIVRKNSIQDDWPVSKTDLNSTLDLSKKSTLMQDSQLSEIIKKDSRPAKGSWSVFTPVLIIIIMICCGCVGGLVVNEYLAGGFKSTISSPVSSTHKVKVKINGDAFWPSLSVRVITDGHESHKDTYLHKSGKSLLPYIFSITQNTGDYIEIIAKGDNQFTTFMSCEIWVDDKLWRSSKDESGWYSTAICSGFIGQP